MNMQYLLSSGLLELDAVCGGLLAFKHFSVTSAYHCSLLTVYKMIKNSIKCESRCLNMEIVATQEGMRACNKLRGANLPFRPNLFTRK